MQIDRIKPQEANSFLRGGHYLGGATYLPTYCLATKERDAVALYAPPTAWHFKAILPGALELTRLWQSDSRRESGAPLSDFVKATLRWIEDHDPLCVGVFSYADPSQIGPNGKPHSGGVYQWAGFHKLGQSRVTDIWRDPATGELLSSPICYRRFHTKSRKYLSGTGEYECTHKTCKTHRHKGPGLTLIPKLPKILYVYGLSFSVAQIRESIGGRYA